MVRLPPLPLNGLCPHCQQVCQNTPIGGNPVGYYTCNICGERYVIPLSEIPDSKGSGPQEFYDTLRHRGVERSRLHIKLCRYLQIYSPFLSKSQLTWLKEKIAEFEAKLERQSN